MTLENIYYVSQTLAVGAILISLIAIWLQMRQSIRMERAKAQRELLERVSEWTDWRGQEAFDQWLIGLSKYDAAGTHIANSTEVLLYRWAFITEAAFNMHRDGFFTDGTWAGIEGMMLGLLRTPGGEKWWEGAQSVVGSEVAQHLNDRLAKVDPAEPNYLDSSPLYRQRLSELEIQSSD